MTVKRSDEPRLGRKPIEISPSMREILDLIPPEVIVTRHGVIPALGMIGIDAVIEVIGVRGLIAAIGEDGFRSFPEGLELMEIWKKHLTEAGFRALFQK